MIDPMEVGNEMNEAYCDGFEAGVQSAKPKWISVTKRVPEKYGTYLVCTARGAFMVGCYYPQAKNWNVRATVTHWMPLPEKPKGETND